MPTGGRHPLRMVGGVADHLRRRPLFLGWAIDMKLFLVTACILISLALGACATTYQSSSISGGFSSKQIEGDVFRVSFSANGYSSRETAQTYWLYRCSEVALDNGYEGFEILSNINLVMPLSPEHFFAPDHLAQKVQYMPIFIPMDSGNKPHIEADIRLLHAPITEAPPRVFDASKLKAVLDPYVNGEKCAMGNVCEHVHRYLFPPDKFK